MLNYLLLSISIISFLAFISCDEQNSNVDEYDSYRIQNSIPNDIFDDILFDYAAAKLDKEQNKCFVLLTNSPEIIAGFDGSTSEDYLLIELSSTINGNYYFNKTASLTLLIDGIYYYSQSGDISFEEQDGHLYIKFNAVTMSYQTTTYLNLFQSEISVKIFNDSEFGYQGKDNNKNEDFDENFVKFSMRMNGVLFDDRIFHFQSVENCTPVYTENKNQLNIYIKGISESLITEKNVEVFIKLNTEPKPNTIGLYENGLNTFMLIGGEEAFKFHQGQLEIISFDNKIGGIIEAKFSGYLFDPFTYKYIKVDNGYFKLKISG